jgi:hypothetical protein
MGAKTIQNKKTEIYSVNAMHPAGVEPATF